jgi:hypothetical protein
MDPTWEWHGLMENAERVLGSDVRAVAKRLKRPITLRIRTKAETERAWSLEAFSFVERDWYHRFEGHTSKQKIVDHLQGIHAEPSRWAIAHIACDLYETEAHGSKAVDIASILIAFAEMRQRIRRGTAHG